MHLDVEIELVFLVFSGERIAPPRADCGASPQFLFAKVRDREGAITSTRGACAPRRAVLRRERAERARACSKSIQRMTFGRAARYRALPAGTRFLAEEEPQAFRKPDRHEQDRQLPAPGFLPALSKRRAAFCSTRF